MSLFQLKDVKVEYGMGESRVYALKGIDLEIKEQEQIAIIGPSGSGKSTLLNVLSGLENITSGEIYYNGTAFHQLSQKKLSEMRLKNFGFVFQAFYLISSMTVQDNIYLPAITLEGKVDKELFDELIEQLGLKERMKHLPGQLSGGEKQRVAIARALINKPKVIFADEPSGNLDSRNGNMVFDLLFRFSEKYKQTLIYVTHDLEKASLAKRQIQIKDGVVTE